MVYNSSTLDVILPVGNFDYALTECLDSLKRQTMQNFRLIIVDNTIEGLPRNIFNVEQEVIFFRNPVRGYVQTINYAYDNVVSWSDYVTIVNSDDLVHPQKFEIQISEMLLSNSNISFTDISKFLTNNRETYSVWKNFPLETWHPIFLLFNFQGADATLMFDKTTWLKFGRLNNKVHHDLADLERSLRIFSESTIKYSIIPRKLYSYRTSKNQISKTRAQFQDFKTIERSLQNFLRKFNLEGKDLLSLYALRPRGIRELRKAHGANFRYSDISKFLEDIRTILEGLDFDTFDRIHAFEIAARRRLKMLTIQYLPILGYKILYEYIFSLFRAKVHP